MYCKKVKGRDSTAVQASGGISLGRPRQKNKSSFQAIAPGKSDLVPCGTWISTVLVATTYCQKVGNGNPKPRIARKWKAGAPLQSRYLKAFLLAGQEQQIDLSGNHQGKEDEQINVNTQPNICFFHGSWKNDISAMSQNLGGISCVSSRGISSSLFKYM